MKRFLIDKYIFLGILILTITLYWDSFTSPFFQDDKLLIKLGSSGNWLKPIPNFPYRPIPIQIFYGLSNILFGKQVLGYHLIVFGFLIATLIFIYFLVKKLTNSSSKSLVSVFLYATNVSLFGHFYWLATSYSAMSTTFILGAMYFYLQPKINNALIFGLFVVLALLSSELTFVLPLILLTLGWYFHYWPKRFVLSSITVILATVWRLFFVGFHQQSEYVLKFTPQAIATVRWYLFRAINFPEGIGRDSSVYIWILGTLFVTVLIYSVIKYFRKSSSDVRLLILGMYLFLVSAGLFFFLPSHLSSYYLALPLVGFSIVEAEVLDKRVVLGACIIYYCLSFAGLGFLRHTHWMILKNTGPIGKF